MADPFTRDVASIDRELGEQVERREAALVEIIHGCFVAERAGLVIDRLIEERLKVTGQTKREAVKSR